VKGGAIAELLLLWLVVALLLLARVKQLVVVRAKDLVLDGIELGGTRVAGAGGLSAGPIVALEATTHPASVRSQQTSAAEKRESNT
jgi:hypothetical protein